LDFGTGIAVCSLGHAHPRWSAAIAEQAKTLAHTSNLYHTRGQGWLAKTLVECVGSPGRVFFCNSGAEANEALYKLARKYGNEGFGQPRTEIITFVNSFHGRTLAGIAATGQDKVKKGFEPAVTGFKHVPFNDLVAVADAITPDTVAILLEPIQGESGIVPATPEFLKALRRLADEHNLLLMFDEVQCGLGRTGDWCAWKTIGGEDFQADAVSWAKGMGGGFPIGAVWIRDKPIKLQNGESGLLSTLLGPGSHGTTFGGTPLACAAAQAVLDEVRDAGLLENAKTLGKWALEQLRALPSPLIREVRGVGLMIGVELVADFKTQVAQYQEDTRFPSMILVDLLSEAGLLVVPSGASTIRLLPPLNVSQKDLEQGISILGHVLRELSR